MLSLVGYRLHDGDRLKELSLEAMSQGVGARFKHTMTDATHFVGTLELPVGKMSWSGSHDGKKLTGFMLDGIAPTGSLNMNLTQAGDRLTGPLVVKSGDTELFHANMGLLMDEHHSALSLEVLGSEGTGSTIKASIDLTHTTTPFMADIVAPSPTKPIQGLIDAIDAIATKQDTFSEQPSTIASPESRDAGTVAIPN